MNKQLGKNIVIATFIIFLIVGVIFLLKIPNLIKNITFPSTICEKVDLGKNFSRDCHFAYYYGRLIEGSHGPSFQISSDLHIIRDKNHIYKIDQKLDEGFDPNFVPTPPSISIFDGIDATSFKILDKYYSKDKNFGYGGFRSENFLVKINNSDGKTFEVFKDTTYAKDKKSAYWQGIGFNVDVKSFEYIGENKEYISPNHDGYASCSQNGCINHYAKDKNNIYIDNKKIDADPNTFVILEYGYSKDKNHVYFNNLIIPEADPKNFQVFANSTFPDGTTIGPQLTSRYSRDDNNVYYIQYSEDIKIIKVSEADPKSFTTNPSNKFEDSHDNNSSFKNGAPRILINSKNTDKPYVVSCSDTDGGKNFLLKGTVTQQKSDGSITQNSDSCFGKEIKEAYCDNFDGSGEVLVENYFLCPKGLKCADGACVSN